MCYSDLPSCLPPLPSAQIMYIYGGREKQGIPSSQLLLADSMILIPSKHPVCQCLLKFLNPIHNDHKQLCSSQHIISYSILLENEAQVAFSPCLLYMIVHGSLANIELLE